VAQDPAASLAAATAPDGGALESGEAERKPRARPKHLQIIK